MPRETIRKLAENVERVLLAGAHLAAGDSGLERDKVALEKLVAQLGAKSPPVLARLAEQVGKLRSAKPKEQAPELLSLAMTVAQVRAAQAALAPAGDDEPLASAAAVGTPCNAKDLYALHDALITTGSGRLERVRDALERNDIADLRLVHAVIQAMGDHYGDIAELVSNQVVPAFGRAIVDPVRARLKFPGRTVDGRRLAALIAVEKAGALPLVERALAEGSADVREAALDAVATHVPGVPEFEPLVLGLLKEERAGGVRRAAIRALKGFGSDASFKALLAALDDARTAAEAAEALGQSKHPEAADRLLERLEAAVPKAKLKVKKGDKKGEAARIAQRRQVELLFGALGELQEARVVPIAAKLVDEFGADAARAVLISDDPDHWRALADRIEGKDEGLFAVAVEAALRLDADEAFERLSPIVRAKDREAKLTVMRLAALQHSTFVPAGERWIELLIDASKSSPRSEHIIDLLGATKDPRAMEALLGLLEVQRKHPGTVASVARALARIGDPRAVDALLGVVSANLKYHLWWIFESIEQLADESTVDKVRTIVTAEKDQNASTVRYLLNRLERKFPGA
jgi:HEAT repeat protein